MVTLRNEMSFHVPLIETSLRGLGGGKNQSQFIKSPLFAYGRYCLQRRYPGMLEN